MPRRRLLGQLSPSYLLLTLLTTAAVCGISIHSHQTWAMASARHHLSGLAQALAHAWHDPAAGNQDATAPSASGQSAGERPTNGADSLAAACHLLAEGSEAQFVVLGPQNHIEASSQPRVSEAEQLGDRPEIRKAWLGQTETAVRSSADTGLRTLYVALPVGSPEAVQAVVYAAESLRGVDQSISQFQNRMVISGCLLVLATTLAVPLLSRRITRPMEEMRVAAERFARGELGFRLAVPDTEEMAGLAESLNQMSEQLQERIGTIVRQNNEQQAVLSSMVEGVLAVDNQQRVISLNKASGQLLGIDQVQAQGRSLQELVRNADLQRFVARALECHEPIDDDLVVHGHHEAVLQARGAALHDARGRSIGAVVVLNDVTDFRRLEYIRRDFVANVSHELKTPITSIKGFVETLLDGAVHNPEDAERFLQIVAKQADRLDLIIEDLLCLSKIEQGEEQGDIVLEKRRVKDVLDAAVHNCQQKTLERQIHVCTACDDDVTALMNPQLLEQAVMNLLENAIKYSDPASEVQVLASRHFNEVTITVSDRGCGIAAEHLPRIFERFYRVDKARSRKLGGTGLGLAIVKHIVQAHRGHVTVKSTPGLGSVFTIHLPRPDDDRQEQAA